MSEPTWDVENERDKFVAGQDSEHDGHSLMELIMNYWIYEAGISPEVIELTMLSIGKEISGGFDALLLCFRSYLLDAIEGRIIRP